MTVPTSYTLQEFANYLHTEVMPRQAAFLGYSADADTGSYGEPITDALLQMRLTNIDRVVPAAILEFRLRGSIAALQKAKREFATAYDIGGLAQTLERSQLYKQTKELIQDLELQLKNLLIDEQLDRGMLPRGAPLSHVRPTRAVWAMSTGAYDDRYDDATD